MKSTSDQKLSAVDPSRRLGTICAVFPNRAMVNLGDAAARSGTNLYGHPLGTGQVGEFVLIGSDDQLLIGRMSSVRLVERDRLSINPVLDERPSVDPIGEIDLLASLDCITNAVIPGIENHPRLGSAVYSPAPKLMAELISEGGTPNAKLCVVLNLGSASGVPDSRVRVSPERMFGRHCGILGATGGGKSFTIAKLVEECSAHNGKALLIDATGEFYTQGDAAEHVSLGSPLHGESEVHLPFSALEEQDLYGLFQPSGKVQGPKLREAIHSLRIAHILNSTTDPTLIALRTALQASGSLKGAQIIKAALARKPFEDAMNALRSRIELPNAGFDIQSLSLQVLNECIWATNFNDKSKFGGSDGNEAYCAPLVARINAVVSGPDLRVVFESKGDSILDRIRLFLAGDGKVLRISLATVPFSFHAREIVANALGRHLLALARSGSFKKRPLVVFLDEAHNFLNRNVGEEDGQIKLDAFDQVAKEGRKYWLSICLATQRPRDLPEGVLSQMGTMIVHRLTNHRDREVVERACGDIDRAAVAFLPTLAPGQAAIVGADFPFPLTVTMDMPLHHPDSAGPDFQSTWKIKV